MPPSCETSAGEVPVITTGNASGEPPLIHFGLRPFFLFISGVALLLGAMAMMRGGWAVALGFAAAMVAAHVLATFVGTTLRNSSREKQRRMAARVGANSAEDPPVRGPLSPAELAALTATPLARHEHAPFRTLTAIGAGALGGGTLGAALIPLIAGPQTTGAEIGLGAISCAVMGAWAALLAAHFWSVARRTWRDAKGESASTRKRRRWRSAPSGSGTPDH